MAFPSTKTVLVLTQQLEAHADLVIAELNRREVPVVRFDTADFPQRATLVARKRQMLAANGAGSRTRQGFLSARQSSICWSQSKQKGWMNATA